MPLNAPIKVERIDPATIRLDWTSAQINSPLLIYAGGSPDSIDRQTALLRTTAETSVMIRNLVPDKRYYFALVPDQGPEMIASERRVMLDGTTNFRDLGGYPACDGGRVKWGKVFRSDALSRLTEKGQKQLAEMGVQLVCDFRAATETQKAPDCLPVDGSVRYLHLPIDSAQFDTVTAIDKIKKGDTDWLSTPFMVTGYLTNLESYAAMFGSVLTHLAAPENRPLVFHCTAGKDRTGLCAALILLVLGVSEEIVIADHQLSNLYLTDFLPKIKRYLKSFNVEIEKVMPYLVAPREALEAVIAQVHSRYGTAENYFRTKASLSRKTLDDLKNGLLE